MQKITETERRELRRKLGELMWRTKNGTIPFEGTMTSLQKIIQGNFSPADSIAFEADWFTTKVDYAAPVAELMKAGKFVYINPFVISKASKDYRPLGHDASDLIVGFAYFLRDIKIDDAMTEFISSRIKPLELHELLTIARSRRIPQHQAILAPNTAWQNDHGIKVIPYLRVSETHRILSVYQVDKIKLDCHCRYAVARA